MKSTDPAATNSHTMIARSDPRPDLIQISRADLVAVQDALAWMDYHKDNQDMSHVSFRIGAGNEARSAHAMIEEWLK